MQIRNHYVVKFACNSLFSAILPAGLIFSLSGLSAESEKRILLCGLCVSSEAGGEFIQTYRNTRLSKKLNSLLTESTRPGSISAVTTSSFSPPSAITCPSGSTIMLCPAY